MTWIRTIPVEAADGRLRENYQAARAFYPAEYEQDVPAVRRPDGTTDSVTASHSLIPEALLHGMSTHGVLLSPELPLSRRQHEMIATVVSALNSCFY
jgi:hypothetical protein